MLRPCDSDCRVFDCSFARTGPWDQTLQTSRAALLSNAAGIGAGNAASAVGAVVREVATPPRKAGVWAEGEEAGHHSFLHKERITQNNKCSKEFLIVKEMQHKIFF